MSSRIEPWTVLFLLLPLTTTGHTFSHRNNETIILQETTPTTTTTTTTATANDEENRKQSVFHTFHNSPTSEVIKEDNNGGKESEHYKKKNSPSSANKENESGITVAWSESLKNDEDGHRDIDPRRMAKSIVPNFAEINEKIELLPQTRDLEEAVNYGLKAMRELLEVEEPKWYNMGLYLDKKDPASHVAAFGAPSKRALELSILGYAAIEASRKIAQTFPENVGRQSAGFQFESRLLEDECPIRGLPRCTKASRRYRTADGTCNNLKRPWRGSSLLPYQRFLRPVYEDGIQEVRRSIFGRKLPSARDVSIRIHRDKNQELQTVNLMLMQWGQLIDHDLTSTAKSRSFNGSIPRCCERGGLDLLPPDLLHPNCLPIEVSDDDWFLAPFGQRCIEFTRSAPSTRINCDLGWREQLNQVTSFIDGSTIYGSDLETADSIRTFLNGKLQYGRPQGREPLQPPDPPGGELCRSGALTSDCFERGDGRVSEQPGLTALHTILLRYHNKVATVLAQTNSHWSDEKIYQETRRIVGAVVQHITYKEFLPIVLGLEVMELFDLKLLKKGFYEGYDHRVNPSIANAFSTAAFRFGHSMVQNSFMRFDMKHRPLFNNVSLHQEQENVENIWSEGSIDRLILGFCNQPSQKRDEFICEELTNHLFQSSDIPFGMDLAAVNIQRGRDHGLPSYTSWREPCGLNPIKSWTDLQKIMNPETVHRFKQLYDDIDDIDLFSGGLAEKPVRGGIVGPTFACIIAQQFSNLRKGDRFWYENGDTESSFSPAQLQQLRHVTLAQVLCQSLNEIETIQPFVFLAPDGFRNKRLDCNDPIINNFDLSPWIEKTKDGREPRKRKKDTTQKPPPIVSIVNVTTKVEHKQYGSYQRPVTYLYGTAQKPTTSNPQKPLEVNIKIQYYPPPVTSTTTTTTRRPTQKRRRTTTRRPTRSTTRTTTQRPYEYNRPIYIQSQTPNYYDEMPARPPTQYRPEYSDDFSVYRPVYTVNRPDDYDRYEDRPFSTSPRPYIYRPNSHHYVYSDVYSTRPTTKYPPYLYTYNHRPTSSGYNKQESETIDKFYTEVLDQLDFGSMPKRPSFGQTDDDDDRLYPIAHIEKIPSVHDKLDFMTRQKQKTKYVKISTVKGQKILSANSHPNVELHIAQREGDSDMNLADARIVDIDVMPNQERWVLYNATDETVTEDDIYKLPDQLDYSDELPRPIVKYTTTDKTTGKKDTNEIIDKDRN